MANTVIQLKYSDLTSTPTDLAQGEAAYSNSSSKLFIGLSDGSEVAIGGAYYTGLLDAATASATPDTLVLRDAEGSVTPIVFYANIVGTIEGTANSANRWETARDLGLAGDATGNVSIDGTENETLTVTLANSDVAAGTYGGATQIPTFVVDSKGRLTSAANVAISTSLSTAGDSGTDTVDLGTDTLTFKGGDGVTTNMVGANTTLMIDVDNTVVRTTGGTITGDLAVSGNLIVSGNTITADVETISVQDSLVKYANNNFTDALDIGFYGQYNDGSDKYTAFIRDASDSGKFKILTGGTVEPDAANTVDTGTFSIGTLVANIESQSVTVNGVDISTRLDSSFEHANSSFGHANGAFDAANTAQTTAGSAYAHANGAFDAANTDFTNISTTAGVYADASIVPVITLAANGRVSSIVNTSIAIGASAITSGTLGVDRGGTGASTFSTNGVIISGASGTSALSAVASATEGHVLQINSSGVPVFAHLSGGSF